MPCTLTVLSVHMSHQLSIALSSAQNRRRPVRLHTHVRRSALSETIKRQHWLAGGYTTASKLHIDMLECKCRACRSTILLYTSNQRVVGDKPEVQHRLVIAQVEHEQAADCEKENRVHVVRLQVVEASEALQKCTLQTN